MTARKVLSDEDVVELSEVLEFVADFFAGSRHELLSEVFETFCPGYALCELEEVLRRFGAQLMARRR